MSTKTPMAVTWENPAEFARASAQLNTALQKSNPIIRNNSFYKTSAAIADRFQNIDSNTSVRDSFSSIDYAFFRPGERTPLHFRDVIASCMGAYEKTPIIRAIVDLMSDFTVQGIELIHEDPEIQNFYREWFKKARGEDRSERIANCLYKAGNVIIKRANAKLRDDVVEDWKKTIAQELDVDHEEQEPVQPNEIPYRYTIINPIIVEVLGEHMAAFSGKVHYILKLPSTFYNTMSMPLTSYNPALLTEGLPVDIQQAIDKNDRYLLLDSNKLVTLFYKKDDWNVWAYPLLYPLLDELIFLAKMKQADISALDGVISKVRIWKLGSLEHKLFPTDAAIGKLANILLNHVAGGAMDFIWGPDIELAESSTDIGKFLGSEKYEYVMNTIHAGLGIPAAIDRSKGSMTDNFMSLKVLMERLKYGRRIITSFWEAEIRLVQRAMGFKTPARVIYANMSLDDEVAEKALWIQLADRNIVPTSAVQERFERVPEIDNILLKREEAARKSGNVPIKVSPYHDAQPKLSLTKIFAQRGAVTPSELKPPFDIDLKDPSPEHQDQLESTFPDPVALKKAGPPKVAPAKKKKKPVGQSGQGRPGGSKDSKKRNKRSPKPYSKGTENRLPDGEEDTDSVASTNAQNFMEVTLFANKAQRVLSDTLNPFFLEKYGKANLRQLSDEQAREVELFKFHALYNVSYGMDLTEESIGELVSEPLDCSAEIEQGYKTLCFELQKKSDNPLTYEQLHNIRSYIYALMVCSEVDDADDSI